MPTATTIPDGGFPIVLTADRSLMADYPTLFEAMAAVSQTTLFPEPIVRTLLMRTPAGQTGNGRDPRGRVAPLGLRRIEGALLEGGFTAREVAIVDPSRLHRAIGPSTRLVAVSTGDPMGLGMSSTTMTALLGGSIYPSHLFGSLMRTVRRLKTRYGTFRVLAGGPGAWQLALHDAQCRRLGVDQTVTGFCEGNIVEIVRSAIDADSQPATGNVIKGHRVDMHDIPRLHGATLAGALEISRGCGLGCGFCSLANEPMRHLPPEAICADAQTIVRFGQPNLALLSEDILRYGARGIDPSPSTLIDLLERLRRIDGVRLIQTDHASIRSVASYSDYELRGVRDPMVGDTGCRRPWINVGVETVSEPLLRRSCAPAKVRFDGGRPWSDTCTEQIDRLIAAGFFPLVSLVVDLPGETEDDIRQTTDWVRTIAHRPLAVFPLRMAPLDRSSGFCPRSLTDVHWELFQTAYDINFREAPRMAYDNQAAAGVGPWRRRLIRGLAVGNIVLWKSIFALRRGSTP